MSQRELAQAVTAYVQRTTGRDVALDRHYISRLERGARHWPNVDYRAGFRAVLGAETDAELGFFRSLWAVTSLPPALTDAPPVRFVVTPGMAVIVLPSTHPVLLALVGGKEPGG
jgi:hypothetical protein